MRILQFVSHSSILYHSIGVDENFFPRLLTAGTIEEKIYHRQIFKQFLTNRVLKDPKQQRFFKSNDLFELFVLSDDKDEKTESSTLFAGLCSDVNLSKVSRKKSVDAKEDKATYVDRKRKKSNDAAQNSSFSKIPQCSEVKNKAKIINKSYFKIPSSGGSQSGIENNGSVQIRDVASIDTTVQRSSSNSLSGTELSKQNPELRNTTLNEAAECVHIASSSFSFATQIVPASSTCLLPQSSSEGVQILLPEDINNSKTSSDAASCEVGSRSNETADTITTDGNYPTTNNTINKDFSFNHPVIDTNLTTSDQSNDGSSNSPQTNNASPECSQTASLATAGDDASRDRMRLLAKMLSKQIANKSLSSSLEKKSKSKPVDEPRCSSKADQKREKGKRFEGTRIAYLVKKKKNKNEEKKMEIVSKSQDEYVLSKLFKSSGVHSALSHDVIVDSSDADYMLLESEAERVAKDAMKVVRASRSQCFRPALPANFNQRPKVIKKRFGSNLTQSPFSSEASGSSNGGSKAFSGERPSGIMSSAELLKRMKSQNGIQDACSSNEHMDTSTAANVELLSDIRNFVSFQSGVNGSASTQEILAKFRDHLPKEKTHVFKALLKQICDFRKNSDGNGMWYIKLEFQ